MLIPDDRPSFSQSFLIPGSRRVVQLTFDDGEVVLTMGMIRRRFRVGPSAIARGPIMAGQLKIDPSVLNPSQ